MLDVDAAAVLIEEYGTQAWAKSMRRFSPEPTVIRYERAARYFLEFLEESGADLYHGPPGLLDQFVEWQIGRFEPTSIQTHVAGVVRYLDWRRRQGDPILAFLRPEMPQIDAGPVHILAPVELRRYLDGADRLEEPYRTGLLILPRLGLRVAELSRVLVSDLSTEADGDGSPWVVFSVLGKGRKRRKVPLLPSGNPILKDYLRRYRQDVYLRSQRLGVQCPWLFPSRVLGHAIESTTWRKKVSAIRRLQELVACTPHTLRRTYASMLARHELTTLQIAALLGHGRIDGPSVTQRYITHPTLDLIEALRLKGVDLPTEIQ